MSALIGERASKPFCFAWFQPGGHGMDEDLAGQLIDLPRLTPVFAGARGTGDVPRERPHGGKGSVGANEGDAVSYEGTGSRHQGKGASHTGAEQAASGRVNRRLLNEPVVCQSDILDILGIEPEVPHRRRPVEQRRETCTRQRFPQDRDLRMIDAERNDTQAHHDAGMWTACRWSIEIAFGLAMNASDTLPSQSPAASSPNQQAGMAASERL